MHDARNQHVPIRTCIHCGAQRPKKELLRFALGNHDRLEADPLQCKTGRGAYTCRSRHCVTSAMERRRFNQAFRKAVQLPEASTLPELE